MRGTDSPVNRYIRRTYNQLTAREQAERLGLTTPAVADRRSMLLRKGLVHPSRRRIYRPWSQEERIQVEALFAEGYTPVEVAERLGRTEPALMKFVYRYYERLGMLTDGVHSVRWVAALLGVYSQKVQEWIVEGVLGGRPGVGAGNKGRITDADILAFLENRTAWPDWRPEDITDPSWRAEAERIRASAGAQWLTTQQAADRVHYSWSSMRTWIMERRIPATKRYNAWYVWSADLDGISLPPPRKERAHE